MAQKTMSEDTSHYTPTHPPPSPGFTCPGPLKYFIHMPHKKSKRAAVSPGSPKCTSFHAGGFFGKRSWGKRCRAGAQEEWSRDEKGRPKLSQLSQLPLGTTEAQSCWRPCKPSKTHRTGGAEWWERGAGGTVPTAEKHWTDGNIGQAPTDHSCCDNQEYGSNRIVGGELKMRVGSLPAPLEPPYF